MISLLKWNNKIFDGKMSQIFVKTETVFCSTNVVIEDVMAMRSSWAHLVEFHVQLLKKSRANSIQVSFLEKKWLVTAGFS